MCRATEAGRTATSTVPSGHRSAGVREPPFASRSSDPTAVASSRLVPASSAAHAVRGRATRSAIEPSAVMRPPSSTTTRSARTAASRGSCVTTMHGPAWACRWPRSCRRTSARTSASSAASGSSSSSAAGAGARARASATRCASPPDSRCTRAWRSSCSPRRSSQASACWCADALVWPAARRPNATFSVASRCANSSRSWNTRPMERSSGGTLMAVAGASSTRSPNRTSPASIGCSPATTRSRVVLPAPFGPSTATVSPAATVRSTSSSRSPARARPRTTNEFMRRASGRGAGRGR